MTEESGLLWGKKASVDYDTSDRLDDFVVYDRDKWEGLMFYEVMRVWNFVSDIG